MRFPACLLFLVVASITARGDGPSQAEWPLAKGTYWIYEGDVSWVETNPATKQNEEHHKHLTWRSEVVDTFAREGVALLHGSPLDLTWFTSATQPADRLVLHSGTDYYETTTKAAELFQRFQGPGYRATIPPEGDTNRVNLLLSTPLALGKRMGCSDVIAELLTSRYCPNVDSVTPFDLHEVKGAPRLSHPQCYSIVCQTNPDNDRLDYVPGLGITSYNYHHHGTTMEVDVRLIEFGHQAAK